MKVLEVLVNIDLGNWDFVRSELLANKTDFNLSEEAIADILPEKTKLKNPQKAYNLSLLPGIGQWYAGYFWKGVLSGGIQTTLGLFSIYSLVNGYFFSGTLSRCGFVLHLLSWRSASCHENWPSEGMMK